jgi:hypothetical protein
VTVQIPSGRTALVRLYFGLTPVFALLDLAFGASFRAAGIADAGWRFTYYGFAFACWLLMRRRPSWTPIVGVLESSVNLFLLLYSVMAPIYALPDAITGGGEVALPFGPGRLVNLMLTGTVLIMSFHRHQSDLANLAEGRPRR